jgi:hypothetical protein
MPEQAEPVWRCFHCSEEFNTKESAALHFGTYERQQPICIIDIASFREFEKELEARRNEDTDLHHEISGHIAKIHLACQRAEETGYARGLKDANYQDPSALLARVAELEGEDEVSRAVIDKMARVLADISITLKGEEKELFRHSYHDLGELTTVLKLENELNKVKAAELEAENAKLKELSATNELLQIGKLLRMQDNRCTDQPLWIVQQKRITIGLDTQWSEDDTNIVWLIDDHEIYKGDEEFADLEKMYEEDGTEPPDYTRSAYQTSWEFVTACFTEQGCKDYLVKDGHNLKEPRIYADGSYRNAEYRTIRNWLISLPEPVSKPE